MESERTAEYSAYRPANQQKRQRLIDLATRRLAVAQGKLPHAALIIPSGQIEVALDRIAAGGGAPVALPQVQHGPGGTFIAQLPPRIFELRHKYGFIIQQRQEQEKSWYWLQLDSTGTKPQMRDVPCAPVKDGNPPTHEPSLRQSESVPIGVNSMEVSSNEDSCQQRQQMPVSNPVASPQQPEQAQMFSTFLAHETGADHKRGRRA